MKKPYVWAGIIGAIIVLFNLFGEAILLSKPTDMQAVNIANGATALVWVVFGIFLIWVFIDGKRKEDAGNAAAKPQPYTPEDAARLERMRDWVVSLFILYQMLQSVGSWVLNDYASHALSNLELSFDLVINLVLLYFIVQLLRGKKVMRLVLGGVILMVVVEGALAYFRVGWLTALEDLIVLPYFIYATQAPLTRSNFRIANLILLPVTIACMFGLAYIINAPILHLAQQEAKLEQEYSTQNSVTAQAYTVFLQKSNPGASDIESVEQAANSGNQLVTQILSLISQVKADYSKQLPSVEQQEALEHLDHYADFMELNFEQGNAIVAFMNYASTVNLANPTQAQIVKLNSLKQTVDTYSTQIATAAYIAQSDPIQN